MDAELVRQMYEIGRRQWPGVALPFDAFAEHCARVGGEEWPAEVRTHAADLYLCCACGVGIAEAHHAFEREGVAVARAAIARIRRDADFVQEVLQELLCKLLVGPKAKVREYAARGPLLAWVKVAAARMALDRVRAERASPERLDVGSEVAAHACSPDVLLMKERYGDAFQEALGRAVRALSVRERNVLRMHLVGRCNIDQIGKAYGVHRATAARWLERARSNIYEAAHRDLCVRYAEFTKSEFHSLARNLGAEVELSLFGPSAVVD